MTNDQVGGGVDHEYCARVTLAYLAKLDAKNQEPVMGQRTIDTLEEVRTLPIGAIIRARAGETVAEKSSSGWYQTGLTFPLEPRTAWLPVTVTWEP